MAFIVSDYWQGLGLGTKMVDYVLDIAKEKGVESVYAIMLPDNYRALSLIKKMGFKIEYLSDGTVKASLNLKNEDIDPRCLLDKSLPEPPKEQLKKETPIPKENKVVQNSKKQHPPNSSKLTSEFLWLSTNNVCWQLNHQILIIFTICFRTSLSIVLI